MRRRAQEANGVRVRDYPTQRLARPSRRTMSGCAPCRHAICGELGNRCVKRIAKPLSTGVCMSMYTKHFLAALAVAALTVAGCNRASTPAAVDNDVAKASNDAAKDNSKAMQSQAKTDASANAEVAKADEKADEKKADSAYDVAVTEAEGAHKVAIEKCDALSGDAQKACKDQADAKLELSKANAKAEKADKS